MRTFRNKIFMWAFENKVVFVWIFITILNFLFNNWDASVCVKEKRAQCIVLRISILQNSNEKWTSNRTNNFVCVNLLIIISKSNIKMIILSIKPRYLRQNFLRNGNTSTEFSSHRKFIMSHSIHFHFLLYLKWTISWEWILTGPLTDVQIKSWLWCWVGIAKLSQSSSSSWAELAIFPADPTTHPHPHPPPPTPTWESLYLSFS